MKKRPKGNGGCFSYSSGRVGRAGRLLCSFPRKRKFGYLFRVVRWGGP